MKKLLLICGLLWSALASAQFVPGQVLTAAELNSQFALYAPLTGATFTGPLVSPSITSTSTTQGRLDNTTSLATDAFVNQQGASAVATVPFAGVTGGTYNQATQGSGAQIVVFASGGVVTSSLTISNPGTGYAVGDLLALPSGNSDAVLRVTGVSGGGVTSVGIAYGGSGYTTGNQVTAQAVPPGRRAAVFTGTLTSNLTFIIQNGTFLTASREVEFINNTTGAFTITVKLSNGAGGSTGTGVVLPQGTNNSTALTVYTDGVNDVWLSNTFSGTGAAPLNSPTFTGTVTIPSGASISGYAPLASPTFTGSPVVPGYLTTAAATSTYATIAQATTALAATGGSANGVAIGGTTPAAGSFTTLAASGNDALSYTTTNALSLPSASVVTVTTFTKQFDRVNANFNAATGVFTVPVTGYYQVCGNFSLNSAANVIGSRLLAAIQLNGSTVTGAGGAGWMWSTNVFSWSFGFCSLVSAASGQTLTVVLTQNSGAARALDGTSSNWISINRIP